MSLAIDWTESHLRLAYLIEGVYRDLDGNRHLVRWCGPKTRTGSGLSARSSSASGGFQRAFEPGFQQYEARLSRCVFDKTLGTLKQNIQALSEITFSVDLGDDDLGDGFDPLSLRDMAVSGRWRGQPVRFIVADLDNLDRFEVMAAGTWDRNPTNITAHTFKMTIDVGDSFPPTLTWPMWQVPHEVPANWLVTALLGTWHAGETPAVITASRRAPLAYELNESQRGKWVGQVFGGAPGNLEVWRELAHYGEDARAGTGLGYDYHYCLVSPEFDQFVFDVVYEANDGALHRVTDETTPWLFVWNNTNPRFGPIGTVCKFATDHAMDGVAGRIFGKVGGGPLFVSHGPNYTGTISFSDYNGTLLGQTLTSAEAAPIVYGTDLYGQPHLIFKWIIDEVLGVPGRLHPDAMNDLLLFGASLPLNSWNRACAIPTDIVDEPVSVSAVIQGLMQTTPADLIFKRDASALEFDRKYYAVPRPRPGDLPIATFSEADLSDTVPAIGVKQLADPDGVYSNATTITTANFYAEPDTSAGVMEVTDQRILELSDLSEQDDERVGQVIEGEINFRHWNWAAGQGFETTAGLLETERSRPQPVLEAVHGYPSFRYELGDLIAYEIAGVYHGPGQIRGLRLDLDKQTVTMRTYHQPSLPRAVSIEGDVSRKSKGEQEAKGEKPSHDRIQFARAIPD
ncbi:hypothetical protein CMI37_38250 [Candidatus Pacearchaeota archaeon]|nr:hypothetical protein [Candidatus Pacearchaeota archaeon]